MVAFHVCARPGKRDVNGILWFKIDHILHGSMGCNFDFVQVKEDWFGDLYPLAPCRQARSFAHAWI